MSTKGYGLNNDVTPQKAGKQGLMVNSLTY